MEDPWGSPWASDSPAAKIELPAAPQSAHFSADHLFPRRNSRSPARSRSRSPGWEDDDAWGGWNGGGAVTAAAAADGGVGGVGGSGSGKESPGWGRSPGLMPVQVAPSVRSLSPDPWKEVALKRLDTTLLENEDRRPRSRGASETSGDERVVDSAISLGEEHQLQREKELKSEIPIVVPPLDIDAAEDTWRVEATPGAPVVETVIPAIQLEHSDLDLDAEKPVLEIGHAKEQDEPLSTTDEPVQKEEVNTPEDVFEDAFEEEEEEKQPPAAIEEEEEEEQPPAAIQALEEAAVVPQPELFEPPQPEVEPEIIEPPLPEAEAVTNPQHQVQDSWDDIPEPTAGEVNDLETPATTFQPQVLEPPSPQASKYSVISYPVDLAKLDDLFPSTPSITVEAELVPDVIIDDTFASSSERKAWYRISRFGSMRKHDLGNDENYVRVTWAGSQIRERTTQTVRRWMEEDSITGRVVLGRRFGGSGAVMFNWNSSAPQVEIGEFLGRHSRNSSLTVKSPVASPTASSFGWASSVPSSPVVARHHPLAKEVRPVDAQEVQEAQSPKESKGTDSARQSLSLEPPPAHTRAHIPMPIHIPPTLGMNHHEEDDDWGEMMTATPTDTVSFTDGEDTASNNRYSIPPQSDAQFDKFDTVFESPKLLPPKVEQAVSKRPFSWHLGQTLSKPFKRGAKTPSTPTFPSPLSRPMTPPQVAPARHAHTISASALQTQSLPVRSSLSAEDEETVTKLLGDIPDLTYMLR